MKLWSQSVQYHQHMRYWLAVRPAFLVASLMVTLIGTASAIYYDYGLRAWVLLLALVTTAFVHTGMNVLVAYFDQKRQVNTSSSVFPINSPNTIMMTDAMVQGEVKDWGVTLLWLASLSGAMLVALSGFSLLLIVVTGLLLGLMYAMPPLRLIDRGFGEPIVALVFGGLTPLAAWFVQTGVFSWMPFLIAMPMGMLAMNTLFISEFPQRYLNQTSQHQHWGTRLSPDKSAYLYLFICVVSLLWLMVVLLAGVLPALAWLSLLPFLFLIRANKILLRNMHRPKLLAPAIKLTIITMVMHGILLCVTLLLSAMI